MNWRSTYTKIWTGFDEVTGEMFELEEEVWKRWILKRHLSALYYKKTQGPDWLQISFEAGEIYDDAPGNLLAFSDWDEFYAGLVEWLEKRFECPGLFNGVKPYLPRLDVAFDISIDESERFIRSLHTLPFCKPMRRALTVSAEHILASNTTHNTEFSVYEHDCDPMVVRVELRKKESDAVDRATGLKKVRRTRSSDILNRRIIEQFVIYVLKQSGIRAGVSVLPLRLALDRSTHKSFKRKITNSPGWLKGGDANRKQGDLRKQYGFVLGSVEEGTFEIRHLHEAMMKALVESWG